MSSDSAFDLDAYLARIGYAGPRTPTLAVLHEITACHSMTIPFENLDVVLGRGISLELDAVVRKLVHERRGGYCFEQNFLLLTALAALGFTVTPLSARVRSQQPRGFMPPRTHLFVRVELDGETWMTDAGFGSLSLTAAVRLHPLGAEQITPHEPRRIVHEEGRYFHQVRYGAGEWQDVYEFTGEEMHPIDREIANWWTSTNGNSRFRQNLIAGRALPGGRRVTILNREFTHRARDGTATKREIGSRAELLDLLGQHFGLHFSSDIKLDPPGAPWPE